MQSLRIALGLLAIVTAFFLVLPAEPTLFASRGGAQPASIAIPGSVEPQPVAAEAEAAGSAPVAPVRTVGPTPFEATTLTRLPPVASGAATPPKATEPEQPAIGTPAEAAVAETAPAAEVAATAAPDGPALRLFARPIAVDAGTLKSGEFTLLVAGVEPLASEARCTDGTQAWPCATRARTALRGWLRGRSVLCAVPPEAADAREIIAPCLLGEEDVGEWVVRNGWAHAAPGSRYEDAEREAREARRGVWAYGISEEAAARSGG